MKGAVLMSFPYVFIQFIVNSNAYKGQKTASDIQKEMRKYPIDYQIIKMSGKHHLRSLGKLSEETKEGALVVIVGGDGTLNHCVSLLEEEGIDLPIAYIPAGLGNDFARFMGLSLDIKEALHHLFSIRQAKEIDVLVAYDRLNDKKHYALNSLGFGLDANTNYYMDRKYKKLKSSLGKNSYLLLAARAYIKQNNFSLKISFDDGRIEEFNKSKLALIANNPFFGGGINIYPEADNQDDLIHILVADKIKFYHLIPILGRLFFNQSHLKHKHLFSYDFKSCRLQILDEQRGQKDGEVLEKALYDLDISIKQRLFWI
ncbi:MAG: diacylglycerol kinase family protein [Atopococcus tabaci]|uniref:Diacylglycerol kinase family protein n=1 Tax=Atopococcus tabaci TaxID=269774 RepID=A0AA43UCZ0_9LACT|nr:diacylglycerol kinase family protein [Atopococcus tabaci]